MGEISDHDPAILWSTAENFLRNSYPSAYKEMSKEEVNEYCEHKAAHAKSQAEALMACGIWEGEAWNRAIRSVILESESD